VTLSGALRYASTQFFKNLRQKDGSRFYLFWSVLPVLVGFTCFGRFYLFWQAGVHEVELHGGEAEHDEVGG
jgi:hypothetical protein